MIDSELERPRSAALPPLSFEEWKESGELLHMWTQVVGKVRMALTPPVNHWWHVALYTTARGLTTSPIPYGERTFEIVFDFIDHQLVIETSEGERRTLPLTSLTVAAFYTEVMALLNELGFDVQIWPTPCEVADPIPFEANTQHATYNPEVVSRFWHILLFTDKVFKEFRARFIGKVSPPHFFWGGFDHAVTRFSGRLAPRHPGVPIMPDYITHEAYSHEVSSAGFWPGGGALAGPAYYAYAYPEPEGFKSAPVQPEAAYYSTDMGEFILLYEDVRNASQPEQALLDFLQTTYEAVANLADWDRAALERPA